MRRASIKIDPGVSHISENLKDPNSDDKRAERRWKRREVNRKSLPRNCCDSATRITRKSCGNKSVVTDNNCHMVEGEVDEDYKMFMDTYVSRIDVDRDNHADGSDIDTITGYNNDSDDDVDPQYKLFLENLRQVGKFYVSSVIVGNQLVHIRYGEEEEEEEEEEEQTGNPVESLQSQGRGPCNKRPHSQVSSTPKNVCNSELELGALDEDYQILLNSCRIDGNTERGPCKKRPHSEVSSVPKNNCNSVEAVDADYHIYLDSCRIDCDSPKGKSSSEEEEEEQTGNPVESLDSQGTEREPRNKRTRSEVSSAPKNNCSSELQLDVDEDYQIFLNSYMIAGNTERGHCKKRTRSEVSSVPKNNFNSELELGDVDEDYQIFLNSYMNGNLKGKRSSVRQNSQISDQAINTPVVQCDIDEDYQLFLNSVRIIDGDLVCIRDRKITKKYNVEGGSNSSDTDLILLEPHQICENTPFVSSKTYDSSWFENEKTPRDSRQFPACDHSLFRRRLMEYLEKPYDQKECDEYMQEVHCRRPKDRHFETRQGVVKSYPAYGVNKSYLERYPDVAKAIAEFKDSRRILFLLRGFFFWLQNLTHDGIFRPWLDESCLEILRKF